VSKYYDKMVISNYISLKSVMSLFKCAARTGLKGMQAVSACDAKATGTISCGWQ